LLYNTTTILKPVLKSQYFYLRRKIKQTEAAPYRFTTGALKR